MTKTFQAQSASILLELEDGLLLRRATVQDAGELADFNVRVQSNDPDDPVTWIGAWTRDLIGGEHPTTGAEDFTVVIDPRKDDKIVSTAVLISQTWRYEEIPFGVGRPELIGTDEGYRRRGLVRKQMDVLHEWSQARGQVAQVITGIPYYYRRFGYEMALNLGGSRLFPQDRLRKLAAPAAHDLRVRRASIKDVPVLQGLYDRHCEASMICRVRDEAQWHWELHSANEQTAYHRNFHILEAGADGETAGYFTVSTGPGPGHVTIREIAAASGHSLRAVALRAARLVRDNYTETDDGDGDQARRSTVFVLGQEHPAYRALERELVPYSDPYAWYVRVPDVHGFLETIRPVLERRLEAGVLAGYSGSVRLNCTSDFIRMDWQAGKLVAVDTFEPQRFEDGHAFFPGHSFLQLLFGFRTLKQLNRAHPDCYVENDEAYVLLNTLFPGKPSLPIGLG